MAAGSGNLLSIPARGMTEIGVRYCKWKHCLRFLNNVTHPISNLKNNFELITIDEEKKSALR